MNRRFKWEYLGLMLCLFCSPVMAVLQFIGNVTSTQVSADQVDFSLDDGSVARLQMLHGDLLRVRINPTGSFNNQASGAIAASGLSAPGAQIIDLPDAVYLISQDMIVLVFKAPFRVVVLRPDFSPLLVDDELAVGWDSDTGFIFMRKQAPPQEHYFGLGLRGGPIDRRGRIFTLVNNDIPAYGEFTDRLYNSIPFYIGMQQGTAYGLLLDNPAIPLFDFDSTGDGLLVIGALEGELDYYLFAGPQVSSVMQRYANLTGFMPLPPEWVLGYHQSRFGYQSQQEFLDLAQGFRSRAFPCDALWFDLHYEDQLQLFSWDPIRFPDPIGMNASLEADGFKRITIIDPAVHIFDRLWSFLDAIGFFLTDSSTGGSFMDEIFLGEVSWLDFSKTAMRNWYSESLQVFLSTGVSAVWNDLNEPAQDFMPTAVHDYDGQPRTDQQARNLYALRETSLSFEAQQSLRPDGRPWVLSRAGYAGIQRYAANWSGDTDSTFEDLRVAIQTSLSMAISGQPMFGHDVGGFLGTPTPELFVRWLQFGSYTPFFRNHSIYTAAPREPWQFAEPYASIAKAVIEQRYRMLPYLYSLTAAAAREASPILAPTFYYFPDDPVTYAQDTDFMLGPELLVAPVFTAGALSRSVYLPVGSDWVDTATGTTYNGGQSVTVAAPLDRIPVFARAGAVLPAGPLRQYVNDATPALLAIDVFPGGAQGFTLYEDDGETQAHTGGDYLQTRLEQLQEVDGPRLNIVRIDGSWLPPTRPVEVRFQARATAPLTVDLDGTALPQVASQADLEAAVSAWFYDPVARRLSVRFPDQAAARSLKVMD